MRSLVLLVLMLGLAGGAAAQQPRPPKPPSPPPRPYPTGDASAQRFRVDGSVTAMALRQPDSPVDLEVLSVGEDDRFRTVTLRAANPGRVTVTRYAITAWVVMPDGTVKGSQRFDQRQVLDAGAERTIALTIRTVPVTFTDVIVTAVSETHGAAWRGDSKALMAQAKAAVAP